LERICSSARPPIHVAITRCAIEEEESGRYIPCESGSFINRFFVSTATIVSLARRSIKSSRSNGATHRLRQEDEEIYAGDGPGYG